MGQVSLAYAVDGAMREGKHLLAECPTGTGKSFAYSLPAIVHAVERGGRAVVVTANIALQEQLFRKDLPLLKSLMSKPFNFALMKGVGNYLCREQFEESLSELGAGNMLELPEREQWARVVTWAGQTKLGDVSELPFEALPMVRVKFTTTSEECIGKPCPSYNTCHAMGARALARRADVIVTNYHLYFADLAIRRGGGEGVLPPHDFVVFDEAHAAADVARGFFGFRMTVGSVNWATRLLNAKGKKNQIPKIDPELRERTSELAAHLFDQLTIHGKSKAYRARLRAANLVDWQPLHQSLLKSAQKLNAATQEGSGLEGPDAVKVRRAAERCDVLAQNLRDAMELRAGEDRVVYFLGEAGARCSLESKPVRVGRLLRESLFEPADANMRKTVVMTSATLSVDDSFDYVADELGVVDAGELVAESPFDWKNQCLLVQPFGMPLPKDEGFGPAVAEILVDVVRAAKGRTLALFTSNKVRDMAYQRLLRAGLPYRILCQGKGDGQRTQLLEEFKRDVSSVLLGSASFWAGVDVPGEALSCVFIDRLPFEPPDDPVMDAITDENPRGWFKDFAVPRACLEMKQGFGRLIRTRRDRGAVVVADPRLTSAGYGRKFIRSLPPVRLARSLDELERFFACDP